MLQNETLKNPKKSFWMAANNGYRFKGFASLYPLIMPVSIGFTCAEN